MKTRQFAIAALSLMLLPVASHALSKTTKTTTKAKTSGKAKVAAKKTVAKTPAKTGGPRFVDGVAILDYDGSGSIAISSGTSHVQTTDKGSARGSSVSKVAGSQSSTRSVTQTRSARRETPKRSLPPQFVATDTDGRSISLAQYRGKVVLLDFWATWCPPCRDEAPQIVGIYNKYRRQGFEIVGVSLDTDAAKLASFADANNMTWRQIFGGKAWDSELSRMYRIDHVPNNFLLGKDGTIIATDLHGARLQQAIEYALAER